MKETKERLTQLEEQLYFQEKTITELNEALTNQQFQIDEMEKKMEAMILRIRQLSPVLDDGGVDDGPPPHYGGNI
ncbi:SlyX family protein [Halodesulfovibrio sp.]|jgi:SlyX protein|uniref:SlyX family protein n=1 Tax=Halodesulfovibrio sp. TaxID=1912772 RepID=UPI0025FE7F5C|nr:SlyX family protein [Halodesulfovibrio sp.]MCT4534486.1 SlyX family protein [Halodesulfovibrio sp.]MCT4625984.1 SlyX family protein [Halodesulfovibrio sp.]